MPAATHKATCAYEPMSSDEIALAVGDLVTVKQVYDDGWCLSVNEITKDEGLLPLNFLVPYYEPKVAPRRTSATPAGGLRTVKGFQKPSAADMAAINEKVQLIEANSRERFPESENLKHLKIMICGDSGIGKSELVNTFASQLFIEQLGEPIQSDAEGIIIAHPFSTHKQVPSHIRSEAPQVFNLQIYDTIGYGAYVDAYRTITPINQYVEDQFVKTRKFLRPTFSDSTALVNMMSASEAHTHIDVVLFGIFHRMKPLDVEWLKKLSQLVPIVPVLLKSDTLNASQVFKLKETMIREIIQNDISVYTFGLSLSDCLSMAQMEVEGAIPFAVSNVETEGHQDMYQRINEMEMLKEKVLFTFGEEIRRQASKKFVAWRDSKKGSVAGTTNGVKTAMASPVISRNPVPITITETGNGGAVLSPLQTRAKITPIESSTTLRSNDWDNPSLRRTSQDSDGQSIKSARANQSNATGTPFGKFKLLAKSGLRPK